MYPEPGNLCIPSGFLLRYQSRQYAQEDFGSEAAAQDFLNQRKAKAIIEQKDTLTEDSLKELLSVKIRTEKIAIKDVKLRTFIYLLFSYEYVLTNPAPSK